MRKMIEKLPTGAVAEAARRTGIDSSTYYRAFERPMDEWTKKQREIHLEARKVAKEMKDKQEKELAELKNT